MYLAGSFLMFQALLVVIGVFLSDLALAALDPRIRLAGGRPNERAAAEALRQRSALRSAPGRGP